MLFGCSGLFCFSVNLAYLDPVIVELIEKANALGFTTTDEVLINITANCQGIDVTVKSRRNPSNGVKLALI
jgi:hypothetical protein